MNSINGTILVVMLLCASALAVGAWGLRRYAPNFEFLLPLVLSAIAIVISLFSAFKNEVFPFRPTALGCEFTMAVASSGPQPRSPAIIYSIAFVNDGYGHGVVEWVALKIKRDGEAMLYTPIAEIDFEKFLQGRRNLHGENTKGPFASFVLGSREATKHAILFGQEEKNTAFPFKAWTAGKYEFELWMKTSVDSHSRMVESRIRELTQEMLDSYYAGTGMTITDFKYDVP